MRRSIGALLLGWVMACRQSAPGPVETSVVYDRYHSTVWNYRYQTPAGSEGLDSVQGQLQLFFAHPPSDSALAYPTSNVIGYFWTKLVGSDTVRGAGLIWPANGVLRGRYFEQAGIIRYIAADPPSTFLSHPASELRRVATDTLLYTLGIVRPDSTEVHLAVSFVRP